MRTLFFSIMILVISASVEAQERIFTRSGVIEFSSEAPLEKIEAVNKSGTCVVDLVSGAVQFAVLIKGFAFEKALMEEHFNENYMESSKFPKATFKGKFNDIDPELFRGDEAFELVAAGELTIHGVTREHSATVSFEPEGTGWSSATSFIVLPADHDIKIPNVVRDNIAKEIEVSIVAQLEKMK